MLSIFQNFVVTLLRHKGGANAVEYALIMALVAVFIIAGILAMSGPSGRCLPPWRPASATRRTVVRRCSKGLDPEFRATGKPGRGRSNAAVPPSPGGAYPRKPVGRMR